MTASVTTEGGEGLIGVRGFPSFRQKKSKGWGMEHCGVPGLKIEALRQAQDRLWDTRVWLCGVDLALASGMAAGAGDLDGVCCAFAAGAAILFAVRNSTATGRVCAFLRFSHDSSMRREMSIAAITRPHERLGCGIEARGSAGRESLWSPTFREERGGWST
jgi:hypothetical protein